LLLSVWLAGTPAQAQPAVAPANAAEGQPARTTVLRGGWLFDAVDTARVRNPGIVVRAGKIVAIGATNLDTTEAHVVQLSDGATVLPGFIDLHAHYAVDLFGEGRVEETTGYPLLFLANGATTTFTAGEMQPAKMRRLQRAIDAGERAGPRILRSGPYFGTARPGWDTSRTTASIRREVDRLAAQGVRHFKAKRLRADLLRALIDQAHRHGATVTGHLGSGYRSSVNPRTAIDMGIDRIEHFLGGDQLPADRPAYDALPTAAPSEPAFGRISQHFVRHRVHFDATITAYGYYGAQDPDVFTGWANETQYLTPYMQEVVANREPHDPIERFETIYQIKLNRIKAFYEAGAEDLITLGTDHPSWGQFMAPFGVHRELHAFVKAGIPTGAALRFATINGAEALGMGDRLGTVEVGKWADLVVVDGNPLVDITATRDVAWVMTRGRLYRADALREAAKGTVGPPAPDDADAWKPDRKE
jgi:imidazolonepropionase-like amidohydrolase